MEYQLTRRGRSIDRPVAEESEAHTTIPEVLDQLDQVNHRTAEAIETPDQEYIPRLQGLQASLQARPTGPCPGDLIYKDPIPASTPLLQGVNLKVQILVVLADPGVPDEASPQGFGRAQPTLSCPTFTRHS